MCYNIALSTPAKELERIYGLDFGSELEPRYLSFAFEHPKHPILAMASSGPKVLTGRWGLIPRWVKTQDQAKKMAKSTLNARSETIFEKASFKHAAQFGRVVIPVDGFYEYLTNEEGKTPVFLHKQGEVFSIAGLLEAWQTPEGGWYPGFSLITGPSPESLKFLHHRMPVILPEDSWKTWIDNDLEAEEIDSLMKLANYQGLFWQKAGTLFHKKKENRNKKSVQGEPKKGRSTLA